MRLFSAHDLSKSKAIKDKSQGKPTANQSATEKRPQTARAPFACSGQDGGRDARQRQLQNQPIGRSAYQSARPKGSHYVTNGTEIKTDSGNKGRFGAAGNRRSANQRQIRVCGCGMELSAGLGRMVRHGA